MFYLHWLSLIEFYFRFHPWWFDFVIFLLSLVIVLVIAIWLVLNHFLDWFFFNYIPKHLFSFNFYVKFGQNSFNCYFFIIIFLIGLFFSIPSQKHFILFYFYVKFSPKSFKLLFVLFYIVFFIDFFLSISSFNICLIKNFASCCLRVCL